MKSPGKHVNCTRSDACCILYLVADCETEPPNKRAQMRPVNVMELKTGRKGICETARNDVCHLAANRCTVIEFGVRRIR
jgi:hypothetical protein